MTSSEGYAQRLSDGAFKGSLGLRDAADPPRASLGKAKALADLIRGAKHAVIHSGAGLSTSAGIPDFRGPNGIWTLQKVLSKEGVNLQGRPENLRPRADAAAVSFETARPTLAHMVIVGLYRAGLIKYVISQNVDALHLRSSLPRDALSELHGNLFIEVCSSCHAEYVREFETKSVGFKPTGRACPSCGGDLTDKALDWDDALPEPDFERAVKHSTAADVAIVVGSSCQMDPARGLPFRSKQKRYRTALVNLSRTFMDERFSMTIRTSCDTVFAVLASELNITVPEYVRRIRLNLIARVDSKATFSKHFGDENEGVLDASSACVRCTFWSGSNFDSTDAVPLISSVRFEILESKIEARPSAASLPGQTVLHAPYTCVLPATASQAAVKVRAAVTFASPSAERECVLECMVGDKASARDAIADVADYAMEAAKLVAVEEAAARAHSKRARDGEDVGVWFTKSSLRRGYVRCVSCHSDVAASKKRSHLSGCLVKMERPAV